MATIGVAAPGAALRVMQAVERSLLLVRGRGGPGCDCGATEGKRVEICSTFSPAGIMRADA
jgi:hypothetical protein